MSFGEFMLQHYLITFFRLDYGEAIIGEIPKILLCNRFTGSKYKSLEMKRKQ